jgi:hypothetical protein
MKKLAVILGMLSIVAGLLTAAGAWAADSGPVVRR